MFRNKDPLQLNLPISSNFYLDVKCGIYKLNKCHVSHIQIKLGGNWRDPFLGIFWLVDVHPDAPTALLCVVFIGET